MQVVIHSRLTAPGRMDIVEKVLRNDPFFHSRMTDDQTRFNRKNRRGKRKRYSALTVGIVMSLAKRGLDAARMRRDEVIALAFEYCELPQQAIAA